jgi:apolipoprotein N-acyltransferase
MQRDEGAERWARGLETYAAWLSGRSLLVRMGLALLAGALSALAFEPFSFPPVFFLTLPSLVWMLDGVAPFGRWAPESKGAEEGSEKARFWRSFFSAFAIGWAFGTGTFLLGLYWVAEAFYVEADVFGWMAPFAVLFLSIGLGLFTGLSCSLARLFWVAGYGRLAVLAVCWTAGEWLRGHVLTGFPWNTVAQGTVVSEAMMQSVALLGPYGLGFVVFLAACGLAAYDPRFAYERSALSRSIWQAPMAALLVLALLWIGGALRLATAGEETVAGVRLRVVQPNIPQDQKWLKENRTSIVGQYMRLSASAPSDFTHLIWPESALPFLLEREPILRRAFGRLLEPGQSLILGAVRSEPAEEPGQRDDYFNAVHVIGDEGDILATYDKAHLVPFGEYLPMQGLLEAIGLEQLTRLRGGYASGPGPVTLAVPDAPAVSPLVCYEIIFPGKVTARGPRPGWIVNVTNDAWFGTSGGPYQHLAQARLRAVEEGLAVVRAANTGISAVIDPYGRLLGTIAIETEGVLDRPLPKALAPTPYARFGDWLLLLMLFSALSLVLGREARLRRA